MWSAIFGAEQALQEDAQALPPPSPLKQEPVSPADTASSTPRSSMDRSSFNKRPSLLTEDTDDEDESPMTMLLRRMNALMVKAGEHEFEKKTLVDQMEKDRERMKIEVQALEKQVQELKDQNVQLQYKIEYTSEPMLMERLQDVTDMRDALTTVKAQLEKDLEAKEKALNELKEELAQKEETLLKLQNELEQEKTEREQERADASAQLQDAEVRLQHLTNEAETKHAHEIETLQYQLHEVMQQRDQVAYERDGLSHALAEKEQELAYIQEQKHQEVKNLTAELQQAQHTSEQRLAQVEQDYHQQLAEQKYTNEQRYEELQRASEQRISEKDHQLKQLKAEWAEHGNVAETRLRERIVELENQLEHQTQESETRISVMNQVMEDYKHDCMELWKLNEDLKQQLALASAETMLKEAEFRQKEFSGQSRVSELESQLEEMQEAINRKEQELVMKEEELISIREEAAHQVAAVSKRHDEEENQPWKENAIRVLTEQVATAQHELSDAMDLNLHLNNRNTWLEEQHRELTELNRQLTEASAIATDTSEWETRVHELEAKLHEKERFAETYLLQIEDMESTVVAKSAEIVEVRQRAITERDQLQEMLDEANKQVSALQALLMEVEAAHAEASERLEALQSQNGSSADASSLEQQVHDLQQEIEYLKETNTSLVVEVETLRNDIEASSTTQNSSDVSAEVDDLRAINKKMGAELSALRSTADALRMKEREVSDLQLTLETLHDDLNSMKLVNKNLQQELEDVKQRSAFSAVAAGKHQKATDAELEELQNANWQLEEELENLKTELSEAKENTERLASQLSGQSSVSGEVNVLLAEKESLQEDLDLAQSTVAEAEDKVRDLEASIDEQATIIANLNLQVKNLQDASEESMENVTELEAQLEESLAELEDLKVELQAKSDQCAELEHALEEIRASATGENQGLESALTTAQSDIAKLTGELAHAKSVEQSLLTQLSERDHVHNTLSQELSAVQLERQELEQMLAQVQLSVQQTKDALQGEVSQAREEAVTARESLLELQGEMDQLAGILEKEQAKVAEYEGQILSAQSKLAPLEAQVEKLTSKNQSLVAEMETAREEMEKKDEQYKAQMDKLRVSLKELKQEHAKLNEAFHTKDTEFATMRDDNLTEIIKLRSSLDRLKDEKKRIVPELKQLRVEVEQLREAQLKTEAERVALLSEVDTHLKEVARLQTLLKKAEEAADNNDSELLTQQLRAMEEEKNKVVDEVRQLELVNRRLEETNQELESTLQKSKAFCEDLSRRCEEKVMEVQEELQHAQEERAAESAHLAIMNGSLRHEIEQLAESRYEQERHIEELRLELADLQAEKNVLAARAHRLTQELAQYTDLPEEDAIADSQTAAPDLWELLSSGMEQLKADLELASKYASSIDAATLDGDDGPESEETLAMAS